MNHRLPAIPNLLDALRGFTEETRQATPDHLARVERLARRAAELGVRGRVSRALGRRLRAEGKTIFRQQESEVR